MKWAKTSLSAGAEALFSNVMSEECGIAWPNVEIRRETSVNHELLPNKFMIKDIKVQIMGKWIDWRAHWRLRICWFGRCVRYPVYIIYTPEHFEIEYLHDGCVACGETYLSVGQPGIETVVQFLGSGGIHKIPGTVSGNKCREMVEPIRTESRCRIGLWMRRHWGMPMSYEGLRP